MDRNPDDQWSTPLHFCVWHGITTLVAALIAEGINVDVQSSTSVAATWPREEFPEEPACFPDPGPPGIFGIPRSLQEDLKAMLALKASQCAGQTALHWAAIQGRKEEARRLIEAQADVNAQDMMGNTLRFTWP